MRSTLGNSVTMALRILVDNLNFWTMTVRGGEEEGSNWLIKFIFMTR